MNQLYSENNMIENKNYDKSLLNSVYLTFDNEAKELFNSSNNMKNSYDMNDLNNDNNIALVSQLGGSLIDELTVPEHNNMVPFFGSNITQSTYSGATDGILDTFTGTGKHTFFHKEEAPAFFKPEVATGLPFGRQVETDFEQSRMVTSLSMKNVFPIDQVQVGPGVNDGYTNLPSGGYQQDSAREYALPRTTDEIRVVNKPKLTYTADPVPGASFITDMGIQAPVKKNKPDRFQILQANDGSLPHLNTTLGQQVAAAVYPTSVMKNLLPCHA
jgi:hypothetical protein